MFRPLATRATGRSVPGRLARMVARASWVRMGSQPRIRKGVMASVPPRNPCSSVLVHADEQGSTGQNAGSAESRTPMESIELHGRNVGEEGGRRRHGRTEIRIAGAWILAAV